ncbi:MAG: SUMF1/EgtB/PvdO family nonheme iron enzyme [Chthoniobacteraceae bacterium]
MHRDLAPDNIFVNSTGRLLLANFGLSRFVQDALRRSGADHGKSRLHTLSPQLLDGAPPSPTDDVYGVGTLFFELLTGQPVFSGGDIAEKIRHSIPPRVSQVRDEASDPGESIPPGWDNVIAACLNKRSDERPHRPSEIVFSIEAYAPPAAPLPIAHAESATAAVSEDALTELGPPVTAKHEAETAAEELPAMALELPKEEDEVGPVTTTVAEDEKIGEAQSDHEEPVAAALATESPTLTLTPNVIEPEPLLESVDEMQPEATPETLREPSPEPTVETTAEVIAEPSPEPTLQMKAEPPAETEPGPTSEVKYGPNSEAKPSAKSLPQRSVRLYDTDTDAFSAIFPKRFRFPAAVAAAVVLLLVLVNGYFKGSKEKVGSQPSIATSDPSDRSELTSIKNSVVESSEKPAKATPEASEAREIPVPPEPAAVAKAPTKPPEMMVAAGPTPSIPAVASKSPLPVDQAIAEKSAAVDRLKEGLASTEKAQQARAKEQQAAAAALADAQTAIEQKMKSAAAAKKVADELLAARKQREDEQKEAETAARAAQQLAAEKTRAAENAKKALADFEAQNRDKLAAQDKADAEIKALQQTMAERQKIAEESARAAASAETARQQQLSALQQTEQELAQAKANISKASVEEERRRQTLNSEKQKLDDELAAMRALFEQKMKDIEDRRRQIDGAAKTSAASTAKPSPPATAEVKPPAIATPAPTLPLMAMKTESPVPPAATPVPQAAAPLPVVTSANLNSLGMKFAPVGDIYFCIWQTRVKDFETFAKSVNLKSTAWRGPGFRQGPEHPVVNVTWTETIAFCKWLTDKEHKEGSLAANQFYRLPYDLEWSKAVSLPDESGKTPEARDMGVPDVYPWGTDWPPPKGAGNYTGEETGSDVAIKGYDDGFAWTSPVGSFPPNKFGLYDMGGNVWQWCMDSWNNESKAKVLRGASWYNGALKLSLLSSCRVHAAPDSSTDNYGFRVVRATESSTAKAAKK